MIAPALADTPPRLLDDNRGDNGLAAAESAAFNAAVLLLGFPANPFVAPYLPIVVDGRVLRHPKIHNIYLDDDWDGHNPDAPTVAQIDAFTRELASGHYLDAAAQYGVHQAEFTGSHGRSLLCAPIQPEFDHAELAELNAWITCEVSFSPPVPGLIPPLTGVPQTNDDTLYVVYLPRSMDIVDGGCDQLSAMHFFGAAPNFKIDSVFGVPVPTFYSQTFAYALVPSRCASGGSPQEIRDHMTEAASHEIIEAATDPIVGTGWINNTVVTDVHGGLVSEIFDAFSNIPLDLRAGEAADICEQNAQAPQGPPAFPHPTAPVPLLVDDASLDNRIMVAPYWSAADAEAHVNDPTPFNACVPLLPKTTVKFGTPTFTGGAGQFITSGTPVTIEATDGGSNTGIASVSFRFYPAGTTPPDFTTLPPPVQFAVTGADGPYVIEIFATGNNGLVEVAHQVGAILDNTAPISTIVAPTATQYVHSSTLTLDYSTADGAGSGVATETASVDGSTTLGGHGLASGQAINLLTELSLGPHSFSVEGVDHVTNRGVASVLFTIVVTPESIKDDVKQFLAAGLIKNEGMAQSMLSKLSSAADARARGECGTASNNYQAFINELQAQSGKGVDAQAAAIMIADAEFLIANCP